MALVSDLPKSVLLRCTQNTTRKDDKIHRSRTHGPFLGFERVILLYVRHLELKVELGGVASASSSCPNQLQHAWTSDYLLRAFSLKGVRGQPLRGVHVSRRRRAKQLRNGDRDEPGRAETRSKGTEGGQQN